MTRDEVQAVLDEITIDDRHAHKVNFEAIGGTYVEIQAVVDDIHGIANSITFVQQVQIAEPITAEAVVFAAYVCLLSFAEHELRERFQHAGQRVVYPHAADGTIFREAISPAPALVQMVRHSLLGTDLHLRLG